MGYGKKDNTRPAVSQSAKAVRERASESLMGGLQDALAATANRDTIIHAQLSNIDPDPENGRLGQEELIEALDELCVEIGSAGEPYVPLYEELKSPPAISETARRLYNNCAEQANTYITTGGYAGSPPKVLPADENGRHKIQFGHRRYISYRLAQPITKISSIDVILDKAAGAPDPLQRAIGRVTENTSREDNSLAENILLVARVISKMKGNGADINRSDLARKLGMERTKLSRIVDIIQRGGADNIELLTFIHEQRIEDLTAVSLVFKADSGDWYKLLDELLVAGPSAFRNKYTQNSEPATQKTNMPQSMEEGALAPSVIGASNVQSPKNGRSERTKKTDFRSPQLHEGVLRLLQLLPNDLQGEEENEEDPVERLLKIIIKLNNKA